jgi:hypothetical protein
LGFCGVGKNEGKRIHTQNNQINPKGIYYIFIDTLPIFGLQHCFSNATMSKYFVPNSNFSLFCRAMQLNIHSTILAAHLKT